MTYAKNDVNHEPMERVSLNNPTHLPIHPLPLGVFKVCTVNTRCKFKTTNFGNRHKNFIKDATVVEIRQTPHHGCTNGSTWFGLLHKTQPQPLQNAAPFFSRTLFPTNHGHEMP